MIYYRSIGDDKSLLGVQELQQMIEEREMKLMEVNTKKHKIDRRAEKKA